MAVSGRDCPGTGGQWGEGGAHRPQRGRRQRSRGQPAFGFGGVRPGDAGSVEHIDEVVRLAESTFGPVDFYFANAGIGGGPGLQATEEQWTPRSMST